MQNKRISARASARARPHQKVLDALRSGPRHVYDVAHETGIRAIWRVVFDLEDDGLVFRHDKIIALTRLLGRPGGRGPTLAVIEGGRAAQRRPASLPCGDTGDAA